MLDIWSLYKLEHRKSYLDHEDSLRKSLFDKRVSEIDAHNIDFVNGNSTYQLGLNHLADYTNGELKNLCGCRSACRLVRKDSTILSYTFGELPESVDWRQKGCVTSVKHQEECGSCWAFSATGSLEGQLGLKTGKLVPLSEQQLIDCSSSFGNNGCEGGHYVDAFKYIKAAPGITSEDQYPYVGKQQNTCSYKPHMAVGTVTDYKDLPPYDMNQLMTAVAIFGPISISIDADDPTFYHYLSGIYNYNITPSDERHAVLLVGYGSENGCDYWIIKNSWGVGWGENGYMRIARDSRNVCDVTSEPALPIVSST